jgi:predicted membrane-bound spermidine synthase
MIQDAAITAMFFVSGAASLIFEMAWFYRSSLILGNTVWAASITVSSFMGGLAIGNALIRHAAVRRPLRAYGIAELLVATTGVIAVYALSTRAPLATLPRVVAAGWWTANVLRLTLTFSTLLVPASVMGMTLPLLVGELSRRDHRFGEALGRLYGWNTLGAVAGALAAELLLVPRFGVPGSAWIAAWLDGGVAAAAFWVARRPHVADLSEPAMGVLDDDAAVGSTWLLVAAALAGALLLALEVVWFRFLSMFVLSTTVAMSIMLAIVLAGIGTGALIASRWLAHGSRDRGDISSAAFLAACAVVISYGLFQSLTEGTQAGDWRAVWFATVLTLPASVMSGFLFTFIGNAMSRRHRRAQDAAALVAIANTIGATCGPIAASFVLLPALGMERTMFAAAAGYGVVGVIGMDRPFLVGRLARAGAGAACFVALAAFPFGLMVGTYFDRAAAPYAGDGSRIVATREGISDTILLMQQSWLERPVYDRLVTNGFSMSGTAVSAQRYMRAFVDLPLVLHPAPLRRVLIICYGVGVTVEAATDVPSIESIDVVEISRDVVAVSDLTGDGRRRPLRDPRVRLHLEDGRFFLATVADRFDLITGEPPPPRTPGSVNIYTREYFRLMYERLNEGGMVTYWLPIARPRPGTDVSTIVRAFCDVFEDCSLWNATPFDLILVGSRRLSGPTSATTFAQPWTAGPMAARLREIGFERPEQLAATFLGDRTFADEVAGGAPPLTDDYPQRLRPDLRRLSLSDPRYGVDSRVDGLYRWALDTNRARHAFESSAFVRHRLPASLVSDTLPWFDVQAIVNRVLWEGGKPLRLIDDLDAVLSRTSLRTLPLWILGSDAVKQDIAASAEDTGAVEYAKGLERLSARDYASAASRFASAEQRGLRDPSVRALLVYALARAGNLAGAARLAGGLGSGDADLAQFRAWMHAHFGIQM